VAFTDHRSLPCALRGTEVEAEAKSVAPVDVKKIVIL
jgi:hypothetical protein